ncbi:MAG: hypothetical protein RIC19_00855 [Phaeodactylibacter sp.]|uniref:hypothetical protein n=1 Tax=Phaeodactylibacter sp. TaxID=1940289 RepID=UPI0032EBA532
MINVQHNTVNEEQFRYSKLPAKGLERYEHIRYSALRIDHADFSALLHTLFNKILESHQLFFIYIESKPQTIRAVRSHKKMLYQELQSGQLLPAEVWEEELKTSDGCSLLSAAIQGNKNNIPFILEEQLHTNFRFGCILPKEAAFSPAGMLRALPDFLRPQSKLTRVDTPRLLQYFSAQQAHLFQLPFDANDKLQFSLFAHRQDDVFAAVVSSIDQEYTLPECN